MPYVIKQIIGLAKDQESAESYAKMWKQANNLEALVTIEEKTTEELKQEAPAEFVDRLGAVRDFVKEWHELREQRGVKGALKELPDELTMDTHTASVLE